MEALDWIWNHGDEILVIVGLLLTLASAITKLTQTPKDDAIVAKLIGFFSVLRPRDQVPHLKAPFTPVQTRKDGES